jgi:hypothetical protein
MSLRHWYASFAREFQQWHYRMTPNGYERASGPEFLALLQALNIFSLLLWAPSLLPTWAVIAFCAAAGIGFLLLNRRVIAGLQLPPNYAAWSHNVPGLKEFPRVYGYLALTLVMLAAPVFVSVRPAP